MKKLNLKQVEGYVNKNIVIFHQNKIKPLEKQSLKKLLKKKNPYLFRAKNITIASDFIQNLLEATISSSEEKIFGNFLEELAIYISSKTANGRKSSATGIDLEFNHDNIHHIVSIKSGVNWGNSSNQIKLAQDFLKAQTVLKQSNRTLNVQPILGICYGKTKTNTWKDVALKLVGQSFWYLLSKNENLYTDIIEPLGYKAKQHNDQFNKEKNRLLNLFTQEFLRDFCDNGVINWKKIVQFNSGNLKPPKPSKPTKSP